MKQNTHLKINNLLNGIPIELKENYSKIKLLTTSEMIADETGLIHGGFIFSLADFAAMLAVNHQNVVLGSANVKFLKPVIKGEELQAEGILTKIEGKKLLVDVVVKTNDEVVFKGDFVCFTPEKHVLK